MFKFQVGGRNATFQRHLQNKYPIEATRDAGQAQISRMTTVAQPAFLKFFNNKVKEEMVKIVSFKHLSFSFSENYKFNNLFKIS